MDQITAVNPVIGQSDAATLLGRFGLTASDLAGLAKQGFVSAEYRQCGGRQCGPYYKLRWRSEGRQRVLYLGRNLVLAEQVQAALDAWQAPRRAERATTALLRAARDALRAAKVAAAPQLAREGRYYHGYTARLRRADDQRDCASLVEAPCGRERRET